MNMTQKEFVNLAANSGYCNKQLAKAYAKHKGGDCFTDDDFIVVSRLYECREEYRTKMLAGLHEFNGPGLTSRRDAADDDEPI